MARRWPAGPRQTTHTSGKLGVTVGGTLEKYGLLTVHFGQGQVNSSRHNCDAEGISL